MPDTQETENSEAYGKPIEVSAESVTDEDRDAAEELALILGGIFLALMRGQLVFDPETQTYSYTNENGVVRTISEEEIRAAVLRGQRQVEGMLEAEAQKAANGEKPIQEWQRDTGKLIAAAYLLFGILGIGNIREITERWIDRIKEDIKFHIGYLNKFAQDIAKGKLVTKRQLVVRARKYAAGLNATVHRMKQRVMKIAGYDECCRHRTITESCPACVRWDFEHKGWIPIDDMPPIGTLLCKSYCRCYIEYRKAQDATT